MYGYDGFVELRARAQGDFSEIKRFRAVDTRFKKHELNHLAIVELGTASIWMRL